MSATRSRDTPLLADDAEGIAMLRGVLEGAGYDADGIASALGKGDFSTDPAELPLYLRRMPAGSPLATLVKLLWLGVPVKRAEAADAFAPLPLDRLERLGILEVEDGAARASVALFPYQHLLLAADAREEDLTSERPDHVLGLTPPTLVLSSVTIRRPVEAALDIGTGCGVQALLAASHARKVVGVDINPRALSFAAFNAALNEIENVEWRRGSVFDPVEGSTFDLIVSNPPYVISPEAEFAFRDSGLPGDSFCEGLVRRMPEFLTEGGLAHALVAWVISHEEGWAAPVRRWVEGSGCDALLFHYVTEDPLQYAATWNRSLRSDRAAYAAALDRWAGHHRRLGIEAVAWGTVVLRRRTGENWVKAYEVAGSERVGGTAGVHIERLVEAQDYLAALGDPRALLGETLVLADDHRLDQTLFLREGEGMIEKAVLRLEGGLHFQVAIDDAMAQVVWRLDGRRPLSEVLFEAAHTTVAQEIAPEDFAAAALAEVRRLLELGFVVPAGGV